jgi:unsaturated rhamnogalacturonyl hydrolase
VTLVRFAAATLLACSIVAIGCGSDDPAEQSTPWVCEPTFPSPSDPFAAERAPSSEEVQLAKAIADRTIALHEPTELSWDWGEGTLMFSLVDLYRVTGDTTYRDYYRAWIDHHIDRGYLISMSDRCPPALSALALYQETCEDKYRVVVDDVLDYLYTVAPRTEQGGISHMGTVDLFGETLWVDSLFMFGNVLIRWGELTGNARALSEFSKQYRIFAELLQQDGGLFTHAYGWPGYQDEGVFWARGNSWVTAAGYEYLRVRAERGEQDEAVRASLQRQVDAIIASQDPATGLWWTVMSRPGEIYLETSASALFALGMARGYRLGLLDDSVLPVIDRAMIGVRSKIVLDDQDRPMVTDISGPTTVGEFKDYAAVKLDDDISYGVGAVILALLETSGL